jgi:hypothetical protein
LDVSAITARDLVDAARSLGDQPSIVDVAEAGSASFDRLVATTRLSPGPGRFRRQYAALLLGATAVAPLRGVQAGTASNLTTSNTAQTTVMMTPTTLPLCAGSTTTS